TTGNLIQQLLLGGGTGGGGTTQRPGNAAGFGAQGGQGGTGLGGSGIVPGSVFDLRVTIDERTNSIIVAGPAGALQLIEGLIGRLDDTDADPRRNEVYHLRNASAADVAQALNTFLTNSI